MDPQIEHKVLALDGLDLHYYCAGDPQNELLVMLHPAFGDHRCYHHQFESLAKDYHLIALDMVGHGLSQVKSGRHTIDATADHVVQIMQREGHGRCHLLGCSAGSLIAQDLAYKFPENVSSLTAVGGYPIFGDNPEIRKAQARESLRWLFMILFSMKRFRRYVISVTVVKPQEQLVFADSIAHFSRKSFQAMTGLGKVMRKETEPAYPPLLIVAGEHDLELALRAAEKWHKDEGGSELQIISGAGHCANMDEPVTFNRILTPFLERNTI